MAKSSSIPNWTDPNYKTGLIASYGSDCKTGLIASYGSVVIEVGENLLQFDIILPERGLQCAVCYTVVAQLYGLHDLLPAQMDVYVGGGTVELTETHTLSFSLWAYRRTHSFVSCSIRHQTKLFRFTDLLTMFMCLHT